MNQGVKNERKAASRRERERTASRCSECNCTSSGALMEHDSTAPGDGKGHPAAKVLDISLSLGQLQGSQERGEARVDRQDHCAPL